jgi:hypothetical protein
MVAFLVKLYQHLLASVIHGITDGLYRFRKAIAPDPIAEALHNLLVALGFARPPATA